MEDSSTKEIMVVERGVLLKKRTFQGFSPAGGYDYESLVLKHYHYSPRWEVEDNPNLKQPIAYCIIVNPVEKRIFAYKRAEEEGHYEEKRLRGKWSLGIGGHIDRIDQTSSNPIQASLLRELSEEISWSEPFEPHILGYINDDADMVGKVHFGLLYVLDTKALEIKPRSKEITESRMVTVDEWHEMLHLGESGIEGWSRIASEPILKDLSGKRKA